MMSDLPESLHRNINLQKLGDALRGLELPFGADHVSEDAMPLDEVEGAVRGALSPVKPPPEFRVHLHNNLDLAAKSRLSGLAMEYPKPYREGIIIGLSAGLLAIVSAIVLLIWRVRWQKAE